MEIIDKVTFRLGKHRYKRFIKKLRRVFSNGQSRGGRRMTWPPHLCPIDAKVVDISLYCGDKGAEFDRGVCLRVCAHNLYCLGFRKLGKHPRWYALNSRDKRSYFPNSETTWLPFGEDYNELGGCTQGNMGYYAVEAAICGLLSTEEPDKMKKHIVTLLLFTSEATRSTKISSEIKRRLDNDVNDRVPWQWEGIITSWKTKTTDFIAEYHNDMKEASSSSSTIVKKPRVKEKLRKDIPGPSDQASKKGVVKGKVKDTSAMEIDNYVLKDTHPGDPIESEEDRGDTESETSVEDGTKVFLKESLDKRKELGLLLSSSVIDYEADLKHMYVIGQR